MNPSIAACVNFLEADGVPPIDLNSVEKSEHADVTVAVTRLLDWLSDRASGQIDGPLSILPQFRWSAFLRRIVVCGVLW